MELDVCPMKYEDSGLLNVRLRVLSCIELRRVRMASSRRFTSNENAKDVVADRLSSGLLILVNVLKRGLNQCEFPVRL